MGSGAVQLRPATPAGMTRLARTFVLMLFPFLLAACAGPSLLNSFDRLSGGASGAKLVAEGVPFGGHGQKLDVWAPAAPAKAKRPVLVFFYGGGWQMGDRTSYGFAARAFAREGFVVVVPDYRKVPDVRFPDFLVDGAEAVRWTRDHIAKHGGDPGGIALEGHSAGAYIAVMLGLDRHYLADAGVPEGTVKAVVGLSGPYDFLPLNSGLTQSAFGKWSKPEETQPIAFARKGAPPMLLITSAGDQLVGERNAIRLAERLKAAGSEVKLIRYGPVSHEGVVMSLAVPFSGTAPVLKDSVAFLKAQLGRGG